MTSTFTEFLNTLRRGLGLIGALFSMLALTLAAVYWAPAPIAERLIRDDMHAQAELWKKQVILQMDDAEHSFTTSSVTANDQRFLRLLVEATDVYRFHLFDSAGKIFWSTDGDKIGKTEESAYFHQQVAKGHVYYKTESKPAWEVLESQKVNPTLLSIASPTDHASVPGQAQFEQAQQAAPTEEHSAPTSSAGHNDASQSYLASDTPGTMRQVAEIYVPFMHNGHFDGAIEFYTDITDMRNTFLNRVRLLLAGIAGAVVLTMITAGLFLHRNNTRHVAQLNRRNNKERTIIDQQLRLAREVQLLGELNEWLQSSHSLDELFQMVARFMTHILPNAEGSVYVYSNSRDVLDGSAKWNGGTVKPHIHPEECWGLRRGRTYEYGASEVDFVCDHAEPHDGRPYYCFPILAHGETVGLMHLRASAGHEANFRQNKKLARMCAEQISMAIANVRMRDQLQDQSVRDPLTGLFNRRHMTETLRKAIGNSQNTGAPLSLIAVDVDHFKKFNDNHGHDAGDMILRAVGSALEKACDGDQVACRPGGEEFTLILPGVYDSDALIKAEALRQAVEAISLRYGDKTLPTVTISLGVSHYPQHGSMPQDLMRSADEALYEAKARGRNQVQQAMGAAPEPRDASVNNAVRLSSGRTEQYDKDTQETIEEPTEIKEWDTDLSADRSDAVNTNATDEDSKDDPPIIAAQ